MTREQIIEMCNYIDIKEGHVRRNERPTLDARHENLVGRILEEIEANNLIYAACTCVAIDEYERGYIAGQES